MTKTQKNTYLLLLLIGAFLPLSAQVFNGCITIDFEEIPNTTPQEGVSISNQYYEQFGLTFTLENGIPPVLAQTGSPATAFSSAWGDDMPAPGEDIGSFFLTDNGTLAGLIAIPIILDFETPIDSFGGCILDMDFGELFIIHARDIDGVPMLIDTIVAGDPGTGDGLATCWGFNLNGCEGSVYSVRFEGIRETAGGFGLGLDNLSFCTGGVDIANQIEISSEPLSCTNFTSAITITNSGTEDYQYSLDGINFQTNPFFDDLADGLYTIVVMDSNGCTADFDTEIEFYFEPILITADVIPTSCNEDNGIIAVTATASASIEYSIDGINFQSSNIFENLPPGTYTVTVIDEFGCFDSQVEIVDPSIALTIETLVTDDDLCNDANGSASLTTTGGTGLLSYTVTPNVGSQNGNMFTGLSVGIYTVEAMDELGCIASIEFEIAPGILILEEINGEIQNLTCNSSVGSVTIVNGGTNDFLYSIDGQNFQDDPFFDNLPLGDYTIFIQDENDCIDNYDFSILPYNELAIESLELNHTTCAEDNGSIFIIPNNDNGTSYSLDGINFQIENVFDSLAPGVYPIVLMDEDGCTFTDEITVNPSEVPAIFDIVVSDNICDDLNGSVSINASGGVGMLTYNLNNTGFQALSEFLNLDGGTYLIQVQDSVGCLAEDTIEIVTTPPLLIEDVFTRLPDCNAINGVIAPNISGGTGILWYTLNDNTPTPIDSFTNLAPGQYSIYLVDEVGCEDSMQVIIPFPRCPIFVPNVFSPNGDGINDFFKIFTTRLWDVDILSYDIFDRWGEHVWSSTEFTINTGKKWWDGTFKNERMMPGVYVYMIKVRHLNGTEEFFSGDVTILK